MESKKNLKAQLENMGMYRLKGAVQYTAEKLGCSTASVYRYLGGLIGAEK